MPTGFLFSSQSKLTCVSHMQKRSQTINYKVTGELEPEYSLSCKQKTRKRFRPLSKYTELIKNYLHVARYNFCVCVNFYTFVDLLKWHNSVQKYTVAPIYNYFAHIW